MEEAEKKKAARAAGDTLSSTVPMNLMGMLLAHVSEDDKKTTLSLDIRKYLTRQEGFEGYTGGSIGGHLGHENAKAEGTSDLLAARDRFLKAEEGQRERVSSDPRRLHWPLSLALALSCALPLCLGLTGQEASPRLSGCR